ncbi:hypothetical protein CGCF415_v002326 [Colletotrichum fructicola]|nr:hypothetical protein CGCF415_v002326 [Colletotrichum fructicola]
MRHGVNLTQQGAQGDTILHLLCGPLDDVCSFSEEEYNLSLLRFLFEERRDDAQLRVGVDFRNDYGNTPLMVAVLYGFSGCVQFFLDKGADPGIRGEEGRSLCHGPSSESRWTLSTRCWTTAHALTRTSQRRQA